MSSIPIFNEEHTYVLKDVIDYLAYKAFKGDYKEIYHALVDQENEKLYNIDFVEALACYQGCISGSFCVKDAYVARYNSYHLQKKFGSVAKIDREKVIRNYRRGMYFNENPLLPRSTRDLQVDIAESIKRMRKRDRIYAKLPKKNCSLCGSPDCETFAEDVSRNEADLTDCIFFS